MNCEVLQCQEDWGVPPKPTAKIEVAKCGPYPKLPKLTELYCNQVWNKTVPFSSIKSTFSEKWGR